LLAAGIFEAGELPNDDEQNQIMANLLAQAQDLRHDIQHRVRETLTHNIDLPLVNVVQHFHLDQFEWNATG
jgi:hypothetical protein